MSAAPAISLAASSRPVGKIVFRRPVSWRGRHRRHTATTRMPGMPGGQAPLDQARATPPRQLEHAWPALAGPGYSMIFCPTTSTHHALASSIRQAGHLGGQNYQWKILNLMLAETRRPD